MTESPGDSLESSLFMKDLSSSQQKQCYEEGKEIGRGLVNYSSKDLRRIMGRKSSEIEEILGYKDFDEVINRDNMVLM